MYLVFCRQRLTGRGLTTKSQPSCLLRWYYVGSLTVSLPVLIVLIVILVLVILILIQLIGPDVAGRSLGTGDAALVSSFTSVSSATRHSWIAGVDGL